MSVDLKPSSSVNRERSNLHLFLLLEEVDIAIA